MTNSWNDIANTDVMLIIGANPAENHPCGFKWAIEARRLRNARMIVVDPRFTRTAATADFHVPIRAGSDLAFVGGLIRYVIENNLYAREYVLNYTNASFLVNEDFHCADDGLFSGFDAVKSNYDRDHLELPAEVRSGRRRGTCRKMLRPTLPCRTPIAYFSFFASSIHVIRRRWSNGSPAFLRLSLCG